VTYRVAKAKTRGVLDAGKQKWEEVRGKDRQARPADRRRS
jgi:hypothetical protein